MNRPGNLRITVLVAAMLFTFIRPGDGARADSSAPPPLRAYATKHYDVHTNLTKAQAEPVGRHMDAVYKEYTRRFQNAGLERLRQGRMPLYLFASRNDYLAFLRSIGLAGENTSGLFFIQRGIRGLATWTGGRSVTETYSILQHEGFHQFAAAHFRTPLPIWINEGLAEYFEDAILIKDSMKVGIANGRHITSVKNAIRAGKSASMKELLGLTDQQWINNVHTNPNRARMMYDQAWSVVFFLVHLPARGGASPFDRYLRELGKGKSHEAAWRDAFGAIDPDKLEAAWKQHALTLRPDDLHTALMNMEFLADAMRYLAERGKPVPTNLGALRKQMQAMGFAMVRRQHGYEVKTSALDETIYQYATPSHVRKPFVMLEPQRRDLPSRITAPGLKPEPTLVWKRDSTGALVTRLEFR